LRVKCLGFGVKCSVFRIKCLVVSVYGSGVSVWGMDQPPLRLRLSVKIEDLGWSLEVRLQDRGLMVQGLARPRSLRDWVNFQSKMTERVRMVQGLGSSYA